VITRAIIHSVVGGHVVEYDVTDEWKLSKDGKTLTQTTRLNLRQDSMSNIYIPSGRPDIKRVYRRAEN
jgi:hypothetical protein